MSCVRPLKAFVIPGELTNNGKIQYKITAYICDHVERDARGDWRPVYDSFISAAAGDVSCDYIEVPCGQCVECRLEHAREWSIRCMLEAKEHNDNCFLTLTYDDEHIHTCSGVNPYTGEFQTSFTLVKKDFQDFMKRLRKAAGVKLRYFACGEYGSSTFRPHYHAIVFGLNVPDKKLYKVSPRGDKYYTSSWLDKIWQHGYSIIGECTLESCSYTARYVVKKAQDYSLQEVIESYGMEPEFVLMSRRPGIAAAAAAPELMDKYEHRYLSTPQGSVKYKPPRYFRKIADRYANDNQLNDYFINKVSRSLDNELYNDAVKEVIKNGTDLSYVEYLEALEGKKLRQIQALKRDKV